jgi:hypothetical protein
MAEKQTKSFDERFINWLKWCRLRGIHQDRARSAEGAYRSPQVWEERNPRPAELDINDAVLVNRAYSQLAEKTRRIIKILWFRPHWRPEWQAQKIGCHHTELKDLAAFAMCVMHNRLEFLEQKHKITLKVSVTTVKAVSLPDEAECSPKKALA